MLQIIYRVPQVLKTRGVCRTQHYDEISKGLFPKPVKIGKRGTGWPESEVGAINAARIAGKSDEAIRALVHKLEAARQGGAA